MKIGTIIFWFTLIFGVVVGVLVYGALETSENQVFWAFLFPLNFVIAGFTILVFGLETKKSLKSI
jgi:hypothetical protein